MSGQEFTYERGDLISASVLVFRNRWLSRSALMLQVAAMALIALVITLIPGAAEPNLFAWVGIFACMIGVLACALLAQYLVTLWWGARLNVKHPHLRHPLRLEVSNEGLRMTKKDGDWTYPWSDFTTFHENKHVIALRLGPGLFITIPKRVLPAAELAKIRSRFGR